MKFSCPHFRSGFAWTFFLALAAINLSHLPGFESIGVLTTALILGMLARVMFHIPKQQMQGVRFSGKQLLRIGAVFIGVRLNFELLMHIGPRIFIVAATAVASGLFFIIWLGRVLGLSSNLSLLIAIDTSICGGSAVSCVAPLINASDEEMALAIPLGSLLGTLGVVSMSAMAHLFLIKPTSFGIFAGATLQEIGQVVAAASLQPAAMDAGIITKFLRILFLAFIVPGVICWKRRQASSQNILSRCASLLSSLWFVFGFLFIGIIHTLIARKENQCFLENIDRGILTAATFLISMAMTSVGLQLNLRCLRTQGWKAFVAALLGWLVLMGVVGSGILFFFV